MFIQEPDERPHDRQPQEALVQEQDEQAPQLPNDRQPQEASVQEQDEQAHEPQPEAEQETDTQPREPLYYPSSKFNLRSLREVFHEDQFEFGRREIALRLVHQKKTMAYINQRLRDLGADILFQEEFEEISTIDRKHLQP